jgi:hypothetical protein
MRFRCLWILAAAPLSVSALSPWPAESNTSTSVVKLTSLDSEFTHDMSGASWNPSNRTFWVCNNNPGIFWALVQDAAGNWRIATNAAGTQARWTVGGDLEGICLGDYTKPIVYLLNEDGYIIEYNVSTYGVGVTNRVWDIHTICPETSGNGPEAITFVPNEWLQREGFRNNSNQLYTATNGMGGLMFVGSQIGGYVHVFDLKTNANTFTYLGSNQTSRTETADLAFDRATGKLYVWHNISSNFLEVAELNSAVTGGVRRLRTLIEYVGPRTGNLEGFGLVSTPETNNWCMITDDANDNSEGVMLYRQFRPNEDTDADGLSDDWELRYFGTTAASNGTADADGDGHTDLQEFLAGTDPINSQSRLRIESIALEGDDVRVGWRTAGGHTNILQTAPTATNTYTDLSPPMIITGAGETTTNYPEAGGATNFPLRLYRVRLAP